MEGIYHTIPSEVILPEYSSTSSSSTQLLSHVQPYNQKMNKSNKKKLNSLGLNEEEDEDIFSNFAAFKDIPCTTSASTLSSSTSATTSKNGKASSSSMNSQLTSQQSRDENNPSGRGKGRGRGRGRGRGKGRGKKEFESVNTSVENYSEELEPDSGMDIEDSSACVIDSENVAMEHSSIALKNTNALNINDGRNILMTDRNSENDNSSCMKNTDYQHNDKLFSSDSSSVPDIGAKGKEKSVEDVLFQVSTTCNTTSVSAMSAEDLNEEIAALDEVRTYPVNFFNNF